MYVLLTDSSSTRGCLSSFKQYGKIKKKYAILFSIFHVFKENTALKDKVYFEVYQKKLTALTALFWKTELSQSIYYLLLYIIIY